MRTDQKTMNETLCRVFTRLHYPIEVILVCVRWYVAYPLSLRHLEEMMAERGVVVDHSSRCLLRPQPLTPYRATLLCLLHPTSPLRKSPILGFTIQRGKVGRKKRLPYIRVGGVWKYLYRAVDKQGNTVDFLLTARRDKAAARRFFDKAIRNNGEPEIVTMDKSGANKAAIDDINADLDNRIIVRQVKYLNNLVEQDHRAIKRRTRPMLNFQSFRSASHVLASIELMHMIRQGQMGMLGADTMSFADQFYALAGVLRPA
jgi:putative transposase